MQPYQSLRTKMIHYIKREGIDLNHIGTTFPNHGKWKYFDVSESTESFAELDFTKNSYVFYSNIFNDFTEEEIDELNTHWIKVQEYSCIQVRVTLFKRP